MADLELYNLDEKIRWGDEIERQIQREARRDADRQRAMMRQPFLEERLLTDDNPPNCTLAAFKQPRLRKCPFAFDQLSYLDKITQDPDQDAGKCDGGLDGWNWKVDFEGAVGGPFVLKLFWDSEPPEPPYYFAAQRECQNAALLQQMQEALRPATADKGPVRIFPVPENRAEARANLMAFCDEQRAVQKQHDRHEDFADVTSMPRLRRCYGWLRVTGAQLRAAVPRRRWPEWVDCGEVVRGLDPGTDGEYLAVVYEYIEEGDNVAETMQQTIDFLHDAGFHYTICAMARNWKSSMLVDFSDIIHVGGNGWCNVRLLEAKHISAEG
ncbi:hypothetical protein CCM_05542 [Cordyceps militaris CM01]|uniref:Uncharacterized protein n=1 Tax=Cordyceps militaris (strain CM01) TaxID=983644 RepID=G3JKA0_CORMM|nr:uncharacterized protein CCM_05542 [Cordyceps militaris CM01]EGX91384.1 hypothetical protein CCM_05542 [Cordyceps militaris CM01]